MATDFNKPVVTDNYAVMLPAIAQAHKDLARMLEPTATGTHTNVPNETVRWNATTVRWERYNGTAWVTLPAAGNNVYAISISGNSATATALATARTIGGVSFNGTANINLPGVNTAGNQNTTGNAATATKLATARTIGGVSFDGTANINLPGVNTTGNQNTTGNAATSSSCTGNAATATLATKASTISQGGTNGAAMTFNYEGLPGQPTWLWGTSDGLSTYVFNPSNFSVNSATKLSNDTGSAPSYSCRAWVNFNGTGTVAIRASGNVSSITDNGVGDYTVNFTTAMPDANYCVAGSCCLGTSLSNSGSILSEAASSANTFALKTTNAVRVVTSDNNTDSIFDAFTANVAIFR